MCVCVCIQACLSVWACICTFVCMCVYAGKCMSGASRCVVHVCVCMSCAHVCICVCTHLYVPVCFVSHAIPLTSGL